MRLFFGGVNSAHREALPDGTELVSVEAWREDGSGMGSALQTGHAQIAALLRAQ